jgi:hypothetical protein
MISHKFIREICVSSPSDNILALNPLDLRKEARYPDEIGVNTGEKGFISISNTFTMRPLIRYGYAEVKGKSMTISKCLNKLIKKNTG